MVHACTASSLLLLRLLTAVVPAGGLLYVTLGLHHMMPCSNASWTMVDRG
jgi:hypothetical protein